MAATPEEQASNLARLRANPHPHCAPSPARVAQAIKEAWQMPLTHTAPEKAMASILAHGALLAADQIPLPPRPDSAESILGTRGDVFLYLCSMGYPDNEFGFLFEASLTDSVAGRAVATPFDSGGCVAKLLPPGGEDSIAFVRRHEIPVPACRDYLADILAGWFASTDDYLAGNPCGCACGHALGDPLGLTTRPGVPVDKHGRGRTHEVRVPGRVPLDRPHLRAVFVRFENGDFPGLGDLQDTGVAIVPYEVPDTAEASWALRTVCTDYIRRHLLN